MHAIVRVVLVALMLGVAMPVRGGSPEEAPNNDFLQLLRVDLRATKGKIVAESLELTPAELKVFRAAYFEYDAELARLNAEQSMLLRGYAAEYTAIDDTRAQKFMRESFELMRRRQALLERCAHRIENELSPAIAARFAQIEHQMLMLIDVQIASELPLIPRAPAAR